MQNKQILNNSATTRIIAKLKSAQKQYPKLSKAEERELIEKYKDNREELERLLFLHNVRAVFSICKKYALKTKDFDNMVMEGFKGLSVACKNFDINRNIKFITFATKWIFKYVIKEFYDKSYKIDSASISINSKIKNQNNQEDQELTLENYLNNIIEPTYNSIPIMENQLSANEMNDITNKLYDSLKDDTRLSTLDINIFTDMFKGEKVKIKDLALKYNVKTNYITKVKNTILAKFKDLMVNKYHINSMADLMGN